MTEREAAARALNDATKRIESLEKHIMTCANCGSLLICPFCGHDPRAEKRG